MQAVPTPCAPFFVVETTFSTREQAVKLADGALQERHAACASISFINRSMYWWNEQICSEEEWCVRFKTQETKKDSLIEFIQKTHPYQVPQIISYVVQVEHQAYAQWMQSVLAIVPQQGEPL